jgi:hypothetical protein
MTMTARIIAFVEDFFITLMAPFGIVEPVRCRKMTFTGNVYHSEKAFPCGWKNVVNRANKYINTFITNEKAAPLLCGAAEKDELGNLKNYSQNLQSSVEA